MLTIFLERNPKIHCETTVSESFLNKVADYKRYMYCSLYHYAKVLSWIELWLRHHLPKTCKHLFLIILESSPSDSLFKLIFQPPFLFKLPHA